MYKLSRKPLRIGKISPDYPKYSEGMEIKGKSSYAYTEGLLEKLMKEKSPTGKYAGRILFPNGNLKDFVKPIGWWRYMQRNMKVRAAFVINLQEGSWRNGVYIGFKFLNPDTGKEDMPLGPFSLRSTERGIETTL